MNSNILPLLILAGIAVFLILRLRSVLGTRDGFENAPTPMTQPRNDAAHNFDVIEGGPDLDITDHVDENSADAVALADMKRAEPSFSVSEFMSGARGAYEMILMGFENGDIDDLEPFLDDDVFETFQSVIASRNEQGLTIEAEFIGLREMKLSEARFDSQSGLAEITMTYVAELTSVVKDANGEIVEGAHDQVKKQKDVWTFARYMGSDDPNWQLSATDE